MSKIYWHPLMIKLHESEVKLCNLNFARGEEGSQNIELETQIDKQISKHEKLFQQLNKIVVAAMHKG